MAMISGVNGAVYYLEGLTHTISSGDVTYGPHTIISSSIDFESTGYQKGHIIDIAASTNVGKYTVTAVSSGTITISETLISTGAEGATPIISEAEPGIEKCGFFNWTLNYNNEVFDATNFCDASGGKTFVAGIYNWNASAEKYFLSTGGNLTDWIGNTVKIRLFMNYVGVPETTNTAQYFEGDAQVNGISINTPVDALISQTINFQGRGALTEIVRATAWTT